MIYQTRHDNMMQFTSSELQALDRARYDLAALQVEVQLLRLQLIHKANFNPNQPRMPRGNPDGGQWTRVGVGGNGDAGRAPSQIGDDDDTRVGAPSLRSGVETTTLPGNRQIVRDRSGNEPWEAYVNTLRPDGSVSERVVINRDGSAIRSEFSTTPDLTGWDESHTIIGGGGELATFQNLGKTQTILDTSGQVIQVASWTNSGPEIEILRPDLGSGGPFVDDDLGLGGAALLGLGLALYAWFASTATPGQKPVFAYNAKEYRKPEDATAVVPLYVGQLDDEDVQKVCPNIETVQAWTNTAADQARLSGPYSSPAVFGTAVHTRLKALIGKLEPWEVPEGSVFSAEKSLMKTRDEALGIKGSIRIDVFEDRGNLTICVYDIKTGLNGLSAKRVTEIAARVFRNFPHTLRIIIMEVRPTS